MMGEYTYIRIKKQEGDRHCVNDLFAFAHLTGSSSSSSDIGATAMTK